MERIIVKSGINNNTVGNMLLSKKSDIKKLRPLKRKREKEYAASVDTVKEIIVVNTAINRLLRNGCKKLNCSNKYLYESRLGLEGK